LQPFVGLDILSASAAMAVWICSATTPPCIRERERLAFEISDLASLSPELIRPVQTRRSEGGR
jgi:hypothetical protein